VTGGSGFDVLPFHSRRSKIRVIAQIGCRPGLLYGGATPGLATTDATCQASGR